MELSDQMLERIDRYVMGLLSPEEANALEMEIEQNPNLAAEVEKQRQIQAGFRQLGREELKAQLEMIHQEVIEGAAQEASKEAPNLRRLPTPWLVAAAAAVILLVTILLILPTEKHPTQQELFASYVQELDISGSRSKSNGDSTMQQALNFANTGRWLEAARSFERMGQQAGQTNEHWLNAAKCYLKGGDFEAAERIFQNLLSADNLYDQAYWGLSLTYLGRDQAGDVEKCKQTLTEMIAKLTAEGKSKALLDKAQNLQKSLANL